MSENQRKLNCTYFSLFAYHLFIYAIHLHHLVFSNVLKNVKIKQMSTYLSM